MTLRLRGSTSGYAEINAPAVAGDNSLTLPTTAGTIRITNPSGVDGDYTVATGATISGSTNTITASTNGEERVRITSGGNVNIGGNFTETSHPLNISDSTKPSLCLHTGTTQRADFSATTGITSIRSFANSPFTINIGGSGETEAFRITGAGNVGIGTDNPSDALTVYKTNVGNPAGITIRNTETSSTYSHARLRLESQNGAAYGEIWADVANAGLRLGYNSSSTVKIDSTGNIVLLSGKGIDFSATGGAGGTNNAVIGSENELLNDYEYGYWTPTVNSGSNPSSTFTVQRGQYVKVGRQVTVYAYVTFVGGDNGAFRLTNMPYTGDETTSQTTGQNSAASDGTEAVGPVLFTNLNISGMTNLVAYHRGNIVYFYYTLGTDGAIWTEITGAEVGGNPAGGGLIFNFTYFTNG